MRTTSCLLGCGVWDADFYHHVTAKLNLPSDYIYFLESLSQWFDIKYIILVQLDNERQGSLSGQGDRLSVSRGLLSTVACGRWWGDKQAASLRKGGATQLMLLLLDLRNSKELEVRCLEIWKANIICLNSILLSYLTWLLMHFGVAGLCCSVGGREGVFFWPGRILWTSVNYMRVSDFGTSQGCPVVKLTAERGLQAYRWM